MTTNVIPDNARDLIREALRVLENYPTSGVTPGYLGGYDQECVNEAYGLLQEAYAYLPAREREQGDGDGA